MNTDTPACLNYTRCDLSKMTDDDLTTLTNELVKLLDTEHARAARNLHEQIMDVRFLRSGYGWEEYRQ